MSFLRNCWYVAGFSEEASERPFARTFLNEPVVIYRAPDGGLVALDNRCPHRFAPLDRGVVVGDTIQCPYHGLRFNRQGQCVLMPSGDPAPPRARLKVYPIVERYELLWIWMGNPAAADTGAIPDFSALVGSDYGWFNGTLHARGNYQLMVDNLLDLSHSEFLHPLLASKGWAGRNEAKIEQRGESIHVTNIAENDNILPLFARMKPGLSPIGKTVQHERWDAPSLVFLSVEYYAGGDQIIVPSGHFLTPETEATTHYFVRGGQGVMPSNAELTARNRAGVLATFETEDIPIIEAQQRVLGNADLMDAHPAILKSDGGAIRARRLLAKKIRLEARSSIGPESIGPESIDAA